MTSSSTCSSWNLRRFCRQSSPSKLLRHTANPGTRTAKGSRSASGEIQTPINPGVEPVTLNKEYDAFFTVCEGASDLLHVNAVKGWKDHCKTSICFLVEFYIKDIPTYKSCIEVLKQFDHVLFMFDASEPFQKLIKGRGTYLPAGIDTLRFCPYP